MEIKKTIIVDIDNTLLTQNKRKQAILRDLFHVEIPISEIEKDFNLSGILLKISKEAGLDLNEVKDKFSQVFFGKSFNTPKYFDCIDKAQYYLNLLAPKYKIVYLSARVSDLKDETELQLKHYGFPLQDYDTELILMPSIGYNITKELNGAFLDEFHNWSLEFKKKELSVLNEKYNIIAGIGDSMSDLVAYNLNGILSAILKTDFSNIDEAVAIHNASEEAFKIDKYSYIVLDSWEEIYQYIITISSDDDSLKNICIQHSDDYSRWMFDLDNKASLILVASTFCATSFISLLDKNILNSLYFRLIISSGILSSALSMFFSVQAFASRNTHGRSDLKDHDNNEPILLKRIINKIINFFRVLFGKPPLYTRAIADVIKANVNKNQVYSSMYSQVAYLKYFKERYKSLRPDVIVSKTLFTLRDSNYKKILPERYARLFLNITLIIVAIVSFTYILGGEMLTGNYTDETYFITDSGNYEEIITLDDACFVDEPLCLSQNGEKIIQKSCKQNNKYLIYKIVSNNNYTNDTIKNYYTSIKCELIKEYVKSINITKEVIVIE